jgi:hypothetical protein
LESLPLLQRYPFLVQQENRLRQKVLIEFICRLRRTRGAKLGHKDLASALDPCSNGLKDLDKIRQFVSSAGVKLTQLECNQ